MNEPRLALATTILTITIIAAGTSLALSAMLSPECNRPDESQRASRHTVRHYIENPPIRRPEVSFFSYSFLNPPEANTHHIRNSVCNTHTQYPLSFKWEPIGLANPDLAEGECWCFPSPLALKHEQIDVLEPNESYIQFTNTADRNRISASAFIRKKEEHPSSDSLNNIFDVIIRGIGKFLKERIRISSSWTNNKTALTIAGDSDKFIIAITLPPTLVERVKGNLSGSASVETLSSITTSDTKNREWIPDKILKTNNLLMFSPKNTHFDDSVYSLEISVADPTDVLVAVFSNDNARNFIASGPAIIYAPPNK
jgi:hypothetical protein